jgi:tetratricopeptide (TPR) repeat protein
LPVIDLIKTYCQIEARDDGRKIREKLTGKLLTLDRALEPTLPAFLALLDVAVDDPQWRDLDPPQRRQRTLDAVKRLLLRESQAQPLLLVFEDLHWIDSETQALLDNLVESLPTARFFLLVNYRPEYQHGWGNKTYYTQLRIDPLPPESAEELLHDLLGDDAVLQPLKRLLVERTEGNPFFLEEIVRTLVETKLLTGARGAYRLATVFEEIQVPATVQAVLAARIDRLSPEEKRLLQSASVVGENVPLMLLQAIVEMPEEELRRSLAYLQGAEFLYEISLFPELEYTFKHGLTYQVAYNSLLQERRRALHAKLVTAVEKLYAERLTEQVERVAHHAFRGEVWDKAVVYLRQAGEKAAGRSAHREAVVWYEQALRALEQLPGSPDGHEHGIDIRLSLRNSLFSLGDFRQVFGHLSEAQALAERLNDRRRLAAVHVSLSNYFFVTGRPEQALVSAQQGLAIAEALRDATLMVRANQTLGVAYTSMGDYRQGAKFTALAGRLAASLPDEEVDYARAAFSPVVTCRIWAAWCLSELGDFDAAISVAEEALRLATTLEQPLPPVAAAYGFGIVHLRRGDVAGAIPVLEGGLEVSRAARLQPTDYYGAASVLGAAYVLSGRVAEAVALLAPLAEQGPSMEIVLHSLLIAVSLGEAYLAGGRTKDATDLGERTLHLA